MIMTAKSRRFVGVGALDNPLLRIDVAYGIEEATVDRRLPLARELSRSD